MEEQQLEKKKRRTEREELMFSCQYDLEQIYVPPIEV